MPFVLFYPMLKETIFFYLKILLTINELNYLYNKSKDNKYMHILQCSLSKVMVSKVDPSFFVNNMYYTHGGRPFGYRYFWITWI
jgi:hypothetical protein